MRKILIINIILFASIINAFSQSIISGEITDTNKEPLAGASILIAKESIGVITDGNGKYVIENVSEGIYTIEFSYIGHKTQSKVVNLNNSQNLVLDVTLVEDIENLQEVEIIGRKAKSYKSNITYVNRVGLPVKQSPVAVNSVTKELIRDLNIHSLKDAIKNSPSVVRSGSYNDHYKIRGFSEDSYILVNGSKMAKTSHSPITIPNVERVEILMGASSSLYGNASPGGSINLVTKKPLQYSENFLKFTGGSYQEHQFEGDFTGPLSKNGKILYRLNTVYRKTDGRFTVSGEESLFISPSVTFRPNSNTNINVEFTYDDSDGILYNTTPIRNRNVDETPENFSVTQVSDYIRNNKTIINTTLNHKFSDNISLVATYLGMSGKTHLSLHEFDSFISETKYALRYRKREPITRSTSYGAYLRGRFDLSKDIQFNPILGVDVYKTEFDEYNFAAIGETNGVEVFDIENPIYKVRDVNKYGTTWENSRGKTYRKINTYGGYFQSHFKIRDRLNIVLNARIERYESHSNYTNAESNVENIFIPRIAANYQILDNFNLFANFSKGFEPVPVYFQPSDKGENYIDKPMTSTTYEAGIKTSLFKNKLATNATIYYIPRKNVVVSSLLDQLKNKQRDEVSKGFELSANGNLSSNWNLSLSYSYNYVRITKDPEEGLLLRGSEINNIDKQDTSVPFFLFGAFTKYSIDRGPFTGIAFGIGGNYVSERRSGLAGLVYPSYFNTNANVYYKVGSFEMGFMVNNLLDENFIASGNQSTVFIGDPRNYKFTIAYIF